MKLSYHKPEEHSMFQMSDFSCPIENKKMNQEPLFRIIWVYKGQLDLIIDTVAVSITENHLLFLTPHNKVEVVSEDFQALSIAFNKEFYCINTNDHEVSCYGYLFYGSSKVPIVDLNEEDTRSLGLIFEVLREELKYEDHIQGEMLRIVLKRLLIKSTRLTRQLLLNPKIADNKLDVIRKYNVLVEMHFKEKHKVKDYAELLFKSPKTLSNLFKQYSDQSPLQVINERLILEAKRLLSNSQMNIEEISNTLGFVETPHFSKFFKKQVGVAPNFFRKEALKAG